MTGASKDSDAKKVEKKPKTEMYVASEYEEECDESIDE